MNSVLRYTLLAAAAATLALPSNAMAQRPRGLRGFRVFAHAFLDSTRSPALRVTAEIPYKHLVFFKREGWFEARYHVSLSIRRRGSKAEVGETAVIGGEAVARSYAESARSDMHATVSRTFPLDPGSYEVAARLSVEGTDIARQVVLDVDVPNFLATGIGFGSPEVFLTRKPGAVGLTPWKEYRGRTLQADTLGAGVDSTLGVFDEHPVVRFDLYLDHDIDSPMPCTIYYRALDPGHRMVLYGRSEVHLTGREDVFALALDVDNWVPGTYTVNLRVHTKNPDRDASASVDVPVDFTRAMLTTNFDQTLSILSLIATKEELKGLRDATEAQRPKAWLDFWAKRDPDPSTRRNEALEEYLRRVRYVMAHFSQLGPGWRTDRGRVYIEYGPPQRIEHVDDSRGEGEYEIWRYYDSGQVFVFYDRFGLGDYRLIEGNLF